MACASGGGSCPCCYCPGMAMTLLSVSASRGSRHAMAPSRALRPTSQSTRLPPNPPLLPLTVKYPSGFGGRCSRISRGTPEAQSHLCVSAFPWGWPWEAQSSPRPGAGGPVRVLRSCPGPRPSFPPLESPATKMCIAQGTLLIVMWQPGWEGSLRESGYMYMYG